MRLADLTRLILLAAIWGGSFIFMRVLAPVFGPILTADLRILLAGIVLVTYFSITRFSLNWKTAWKQYLIIGVLNSAIPFSLYSFSAQHIPASYSVILNASSPLFGAICSSIWLSEKLTAKKIIGLLFGTLGVITIAKIPPTEVTPMFGWAILACLTAALCYALTGTYVKKFCSALRPKAIAGASQLLGGIVLLPLAVKNGSNIEFLMTPFLLMNVLGLALLCSAIAYLLYYRLIADIGPTRALTVTFLMPAFGMIWGVLFLGEVVSISMILGTGMIILGTVFVLGINPLKSYRKTNGV